MVRDLALMLCDGGDCVQDLQSLRGQATRFGPVATESRIDDPRKLWKLSELELRSYSR